MSMIQNAICEFIINRLPTGSGINSDWWYKYKETGQKWYLYNDWQYMNEHGCYDGYQSFCIVVDKRDWSCVVKFVGRYRQVVIDEIREYLDDLFCYHMEDIQEKFIDMMEAEPYEKK